MDIKEGEESSIDSIDYEFISKYIREDSCEAEGNLKKSDEDNFLKKFEAKQSGAVEVLGSIGEGESFSDKEYNGFNNHNKWKNKESEKYESDETDEEVEIESDIKSSSKPLTQAKKEFLKHLENENNSLSIDTCDRINKDWKKK
jgi:hypothetical protein